MVATEDLSLTQASAKIVGTCQDLTKVGLAHFCQQNIADLRSSEISMHASIFEQCASASQPFDQSKYYNTETAVRYH